MRCCIRRKRSARRRRIGCSVCRCCSNTLAASAATIIFVPTPLEDLTEGFTMQTLKTILHATDFSDLAANAFHAAFALARAHGARLILLYVKQPQEAIQGEFGLSPPEPEPEPADADIIED